MQLALDVKTAQKYHSNSQIIRVLTESWVNREIYCPNCGTDVSDYENNRPVADFFCPNCAEEYELKSKKDSIGIKVVDGAYRTMVYRLQSEKNPNFFLLSYNLQNYEVLDFLVVPKHFFIPEIIEKRKPLSDTARRAGWIGCNILLQSIPQAGKIFYIRNRKIESKSKVLENWQKTLFLEDEKEITKKRWLLDTMNCIDRLGKEEFSLDEIYAFEKELKTRHPDNNFIKDKLRQQLQILRDKNYLEFISRGKYKLT